MNTRSLRAGWLWGGLLILLGGYLLLRNLNLAPDLGNFWGLVAGAGAVAFLVLWLDNRQQWWWLIPGLSLLGVALVVGLTSTGLVSDNLAGSVFLWLIALAFWLVWLTRREQWWAIIPAGVMTVVGAMPVLSDAASENLVGAVFLLGIGLAFLLVYLVRREHWWALIPSGVMTTLSLMPLAAGALPGPSVAALLFVGIGVTFLILWLLRRRHSTGWAIWPAGASLAAGVVAGSFGSLGGYWPVFFLILPGLWLLYRAVRPRGRIG